MKSLIALVSAIVFLGCSNDTPPAETPEQTPPSAVSEENVTLNSSASAVNTVPAEAAPVAAPTAPTAESTPPKPPVAASVDGAALYGQKCASCHGGKAEKAALNKSQIIANFSEAQVKEALKGYQAGTYGKEMKGLMQGQAKGLSDAQIDALAAHIAAL